jgi:hypothetical protein
MKRMRGILWLILAALCMCLPAAAQAKSVFLGTSATDTSLFGHLDQENPIIQAMWGHNGCPPTATTNALVYLQKNYPSVYSTYLVPDYSPTGMANTAVILGGPSYLNGTYYDDKWHWPPRDLLWGSYNYMQTLDHNMMPRTTWDGTAGPSYLTPWSWTEDRPLPSWAVIGNHPPTAAEIYDSLCASRAVIVLWLDVTLSPDGKQPTGTTFKGHYMTVTGMTWDDASKSGILYYIDPKGGLASSAPMWIIGTAPNELLCIDYKNPNNWYTGSAQLVNKIAFGPPGEAPVQPPTFSQDIDFFDRGLPIYDNSLPPPSNLNNDNVTGPTVPNPKRSNFSYSQLYTATQPTTYQIAGDDVMLGSAGKTYQINTVRVWMVYGTPASQYDHTFASAPNVALKLWAGPAGGSIQPLPVTPTLTRVWYSDGSNYQRVSDGAWRRIWQIDFPVNLKLKGGQKYQFFLDGLFYSSSSITWQSPSLCLDKAALSNNPRQDGTNGQYLVLTLADGVPSGVPSVTSGYDANIQLLGDSVVTRGVTPPLDLLLSD